MGARGDSAARTDTLASALVRWSGVFLSNFQASVESHSLRRFTVTGESFRGAYASDGVIRRFMFDHDIRALSVAIAYDGAVLGKRGYTLSRDVHPEHRHAAARRRKQAE